MSNDRAADWLLSTEGRVARIVFPPLARAERAPGQGARTRDLRAED